MRRFGYRLTRTRLERVKPGRYEGVLPDGTPIVLRKVGNKIRYRAWGGALRVDDCSHWRIAIAGRRVDSARRFQVALRRAREIVQRYVINLDTAETPRRAAE